MIIPVFTATKHDLSKPIPIFTVAKRDLSKKLPVFTVAKHDSSQPIPVFTVAKHDSSPSDPRFYRIQPPHRRVPRQTKNWKTGWSSSFFKQWSG